MEQNQINGWISPSTSTDISAAKSTVSSPQPNYSSRAVQEALEHLASVDLINLCSEAKMEQCRATRDLRSCGRDVQYVLVSCGHASLCSECSQRCDLCPICRTPIPKSGNKLRLRLYHECMEAGLISKKCNEQFHEKEADNQLAVDIQRLYSLFDIALQNNLASLICHYVTDVCMDDFAVSSDPVTAFMLDEVVVKDWCKQAFRNILLELQGIYNLEVEDMKTKLGNILKLTVLLNGILSVVEILESSFKGNLSAQLLDLQLLQENILKTTQHLEIMTWCARFKYLEDVRSQYADFYSWSSAVRERKSAAIKRSWPVAVNQNAQPSKQGGSLFIEDALRNIEEEQGQGKEVGEEVNLAVLQRERERFYRCKIEGVSGCYPFNSLRAAVDILFLHGNSDLVVAKQAILLYYLFDRHWTLPDDTWRHIIEDFAATFGITRHLLLESLTFYLLDDHTDQALQEACNLLPEILGPSTHPKIAEVLLERGLPENALMVLRWSGRDGSQTVSLSEAVTAVRVRVECGLLTESFMHQRMLCCRIKEKKLRGGLLGRDAFDDFRGECQTWEEWVETLVTEICYVSIKTNLVDRMIELPWNSDEEKHIHKCFFDCAIHKPSTTIGSLLVVFYLQRYRYVEAYKVDLELKRLEQDYLSKNVVSEEVSSRMGSVCQWRQGLVAKSIELLPPIQQDQVKTGKLLPEISDVSGGHEVMTTAKFESPLLQKPKLNSLLLSSAVDSSVLQKNLVSGSKQSIIEIPEDFGDSVKSPLLQGDYNSPLVPRERLFATAERRVGPQGNIPMEFNQDISSSPGSHCDSIPNATPFKDMSRSSLTAHSKRTSSRFRKVLPELEHNGFIKQLQNSSPPSSKGVITNSVAISGRRPGLSSDFNRASSPKLSAERQNSYGHNRNSNLTHRDDPLEFSWSGREKDFVIDDREVKSGLLWRSDETSDEEEELSLGKPNVTPPNTNQRRRRLARKRYDL